MCYGHIARVYKVYQVDAEHGFSVVLEKTVVVALTKKRIPTVLPIQVGEIIVLSKPAVKYLGSMIDTKMGFSS